MTIRILASYLANVATAAEHAPFGIPGLFQANRFFNSSLVWAAHSVVASQAKHEQEQTEDTEQRVYNAKVRLHTIAHIYDEYAGEIACPKLELPHVERFLNVDKEPDITRQIADAKKHAMATVQAAIITGRKVDGLYAATYAADMAHAHARLAERKARVNDVYALCHIERDYEMYNEDQVEQFLTQMRSQFISIARANWCYASDVLSGNTEDIRIFEPARYMSMTETKLGCETFLGEMGVRLEALTAWKKRLTERVSEEAQAFEGTLEEAAKLAVEEQAAFEAAETKAAAEAKAANNPRRVIKSASFISDTQAHAEKLAYDAANKAKALKAKVTRAAKQANVATGALGDALVAASKD